jgi:hypothetical protein
MRTVPLNYALATLAAVCGVGLIVFDRDAAVHLGGALVVILGAMYCATCKVVAAIRETNKEADTAFEAGYEMGLDKGYTDGRRTKLAPVTVIRSARVNSSSTVLSHGTPTA